MSAVINAERYDVLSYSLEDLGYDYVRDCEQVNEYLDRNGWVKNEDWFLWIVRDETDQFRGSPVEKIVETALEENEEMNGGDGDNCFFVNVFWN